MNNNKKQGKNPLAVFLPFLITLVVQTVIEFILVEVTFVYDMATYKSGTTYTELITKIYEQSVSAEMIQATLLGYSVTCSVLFAIMYVKMRKQEGNLKNPFTNVASNVPLMIAGVLLFTVSMYFVAVFVMNSVGAMFPEWLAEYEDVLETAGMTDMITPVVILYAVIIGPICEELTFRGLTFKLGLRSMTPRFAIVMQAILFAAFHLNMFQAIYAFVVGIALGYVMYKYDNIILVIIMHILFNSCSVLPVDSLMSANGENAIEYFFWLVGSLTFAYLGILLIKKAAPDINNEKAAADK